MGFASYHEDILLRAAENGFDAGVAGLAHGSGGGPVVSGKATRATRNRTIILDIKVEKDRREAIRALAPGAKQIAYVQVFQTKTGDLVHEFPYRLLKEVKAYLLQIETQYPGALRHRIVTRMELPEDHA
jgi:hypothetical protein